MSQRKNKIPTKGKLRGFTLIEVLLALGIFSSLTLSANQVLNNVLNSNEQSEIVGSALKELQRTLFIMDSDFRQLAARPYRNEGQQLPEQLLELGDGIIDSQGYGVRFVRGGWINPQQLFARGEIVKVAYRLQDQKLERLRWSYPDSSNAAKPAVMTMLNGVEELRFEVSNDGTSWQKSWDKPLEVPKALKIVFKTERYGDIERIYILPAQKVVASEEDSDKK
ncbi:MAG: type II secretion system minor pseudopilin GspJ [Vibrionaceae bacterium]